MALSLSNPATTSSRSEIELKQKRKESSHGPGTNELGRSGKAHEGKHDGRHDGHPGGEHNDMHEDKHDSGAEDALKEVVGTSNNPQELAGTSMISSPTAVSE